MVLTRLADPSQAGRTRSCIFSQLRPLRTSSRRKRQRRRDPRAPNARRPAVALSSNARAPAFYANRLLAGAHVVPGARPRPAEVGLVRAAGTGDAAPARGRARLALVIVLGAR